MKSARRAVEKLQWEVEKRRLAQAERKRADAERERDRGLTELRRELYQQFMGCGDLVFDVGANVGNRVDVFLALRARVVAIEPLPECAQRLRETFGGRCTVVETALGACDGTAQLRRGRDDVLSTMSDRWIESTTASGRFAGDAWADVVPVDVTTLDALISRYGVPRFAKIDVEGFEPEVLAGLSTAIPALSIEYAREYADQTATCIERLESLGDYEYAFSSGESMLLGSWMGPDEILPGIAATAEDLLEWGDVYARLSSAR